MINSEVNETDEVKSHLKKVKLLSVFWVSNVHILKPTLDLPNEE
jgi:hypothetical protein